MAGRARGSLGIRGDCLSRLGGADQHFGGCAEIRRCGEARRAAERWAWRAAERRRARQGRDGCVGRWAGARWDRRAGGSLQRAERLGNHSLNVQGERWRAGGRVRVGCCERAAGRWCARAGGCAGRSGGCEVPLKGARRRGGVGLGIGGHRLCQTEDQQGKAARQGNFEGGEALPSA